MTYVMQDNFNVYDSLPCSAIIFKKNKNFDITYSNKTFDDEFGSKYLKIRDIDKEMLGNVLAEYDIPKSVYFKGKNIHGDIIGIRAFVLSLNDNDAFALMLEDSENSEEILYNKCARYASALKSTDETFFEYNTDTDGLTIFFSNDDRISEIEKKEPFFASIMKNAFIHNDDREKIIRLHDGIRKEKRFEARFRIGKDYDYEWFSVIVRPDASRKNIFSGSARNIDKIVTEEEKLKEKVLIDPLSKVYNRSAAIEKIEKMLDNRLEDCECALLVLDIDNFKRINDTFGHLYGDAVIAMAAGSIKNTLDEDDIIGRFGGDEFFVFVDNANKAELEKKLENIRTSVLKIRLDQNDDKDISCSIGVAMGNGTSKYEELFRQADSALYKAKENGKNRFEYFDGVYSAEAGISYTARANEDESTTEHNITAVALEIASKSQTPEHAIINIMRHIGVAMNLDCIQILKYDCVEDRVDLEYQWWKEIKGEYNVAVTQKRSGYYAHNDLILFKNRFEKDKIFRQTIDFEEGFSQKYKDVFKNMHNVNYLHSSNMSNEDVFYSVTFQTFDLDRVWTQQELNDLSEMTKIMSVYLKSSFVETEREKMLKDRIDYDKDTHMYTLAKFYDESGRITREAKAAGNRMGMLHIDIKDLFSINVTHGWEVGNGMLDNLAKEIVEVKRTKAINARIVGTDIMVVLFHTSLSDEAIIADIEKNLSRICEQYKDLKDPIVIYKAGLAMFDPGWNIGFQIDKAKYAKKNKEFDRCRCYKSEN